METNEFLVEKLKTIVAGETIDWHDYERFMGKANARTLSTLMKAIRAESYLNAVQDKVLTPGMKIGLGVIFAACIVGAIVYLIFTSGG